jgi:transposase InsO family protein
VKTWLEAWRSYYNYVRYHMSLGKAPCGFREEVWSPMACYPSLRMRWERLKVKGMKSV